MFIFSDNVFTNTQNGPLFPDNFIYKAILTNWNQEIFQKMATALTGLFDHNLNGGPIPANKSKLQLC